MSYLALYRKYRPNSFKDLVGQNSVSNIIKNEVLNDKVSHAYLFSGPRGTGKTSTAKIIAKMINCLDLSEDGIPCGKCISCTNFFNSSDIVEIDAASNNGVDEIRELRDKVNLVPTYGKYKIYIIDEVHMLTTQAFNALLKTLEEPPKHIIFILATTEFYKIPITVVSRCQKFQFLKFSNDDIVKRLKYIAEKENILISDEILFEISRLSDGGLRDAINMLDQLSSLKNDNFSVQDVYSLNGIISYVEFYNLLKSIYNNEIINILNFVEEIDKKGKSFEHFVIDFIDFLKDILIYKVTLDFSFGISEKKDMIKDLSNVFSEDQLYDFIMSFNELNMKMKNSSFEKILLISELIKISNGLLVKKKSLRINNEIDLNKQEDNPQKCNNYNIDKFRINMKDTNIIDEKIKKIRINNAFSTASKKLKENFLFEWSNILRKVSDDSNYLSIAGIVNDIEVLVVGEKNIIFLVKYDSLLDRVNLTIDLFEKMLFEYFKCEYKIVFLLGDEWKVEKEKYIFNLKEGKKYSYISEKKDINGFNEENNIELSENIKPGNIEEDINKVVSLLGSNIVSYE